MHICQGANSFSTAQKVHVKFKPHFADPLTMAEARFVVSIPEAAEAAFHLPKSAVRSLGVGRPFFTGISTNPPRTPPPIPRTCALWPGGSFASKAAEEEPRATDGTHPHALAPVPTLEVSAGNFGTRPEQFFCI